jgi:hypothetical protein
VIVNEMPSPREVRLTTFPNDEGYDEMVLPGERILGLLREDRGSRQEFFSLTGISA